MSPLKLKPRPDPLERVLGQEIVLRVVKFLQSHTHGKQEAVQIVSLMVNLQ